LSAQTALVEGHSFDFDAGETIHTESSRKYDLEGFSELVARNGWKATRLWTDEKALFAVFGLA
jgi:uncharacterized SAM-dependent methyltransferase